jgi:hypothetical protein
MERQLYPIAFAALTITLNGCSNASDSAPLEVVVRGPASACTIEIGGRKLTPDELLAIGRAQAKSGRQAHIVSDMANTPYRCIGGAIFTLQRAGFKDVDFAADSSSKL